MNRKKVMKYRFNGHPCFHSGSIKAVKIEDLKRMIREHESKLLNPDDEDATEWTKRWLERMKMELTKKEKGFILKAKDKEIRKRRIENETKEVGETETN